MVTIHPDKLKNIKSKILDIINNCTITSGMLSFVNPDAIDFNKLAHVVTKKNEYQFDEISSMLAFRDAVCYYFSLIKVMNDERIELETLSVPEKDKLLNFVFDYFANVPFTYRVKIPLNHLELPSYDEGSRLHIEHTIIASPIRGFGSTGASKTTTTNIYVPAKGFYSIYEKEYFMKEATLVLNVLFYALLENNIIKRNHNATLKNAIPSFPVFSRKHQISIHTAYIQNTAYPLKEDEYSFPIPYAKYLSELEMNGDITNESFHHKVLFCIQQASSLLDKETLESRNIVSAIDWCIQAEINLDQTMGFIQTCMGLEALLGDNSNDAGLTLTLTDRCAYLIGKGMTERSEIKTQFKAIYQLRSKLVHGRINKISTQDRILCGRATSYLKRAIRKELTHLFE